MFYHIVQIGAYVGMDDVHDILSKENSINALLIEPVPWYFEKLKTNYQNIVNPKRIKFENRVVHTYDGECDFYCVKDLNYKYNYNTEKNWGPEISGTNLNLIKEHEQFLQHENFKYETLKLKCIKSITLLKEYAISGIEYLKIDAEGLDFDLLINWPFDMAAPKYIKFEMCHLDGHINQSTKSKILNEFLINKGYQFFKTEGLDAIYKRKN